MSMFFEGWDNIIRVLAVGSLAYIGLVVLLRISGNRTLSKMNAFDFIVTIALGSTLSSILISKDVTLSQGLTAIALLVGFQFLITWMSIRSQAVRRSVKTEPTLLLRDGEFLHDALTRVRVTEEEVRGAIRQHGMGGLEQVAIVIMETDGSLSVIPKNSAGSLSALNRVVGFDQ
jgi:uncharacterized membrane protein YcaP (DUF421 family)